MDNSEYGEEDGVSIWARGHKFVTHSKIADIDCGDERSHLCAVTGGLSECILCIQNAQD